MSFSRFRGRVVLKSGEQEDTLISLLSGMKKADAERRVNRKTTRNLLGSQKHTPLGGLPSTILLYHHNKQEVSSASAGKESQQWLG